MKTRRTPSLDLETIMPLLINAWRRMRKISGPADVLQTREFRSVVEAVKGLQAQSFKGKSLIGQNYFSDQELLGAYLLYFWVVHYQEGMSILGELPNPPRRVLDLCSGPAPFSFAALRHGAQEVFATDQNAEALKLGAEVAGRYGLALNVRQWNCLKQPIPVEGEFDLIIAAYCLEELFPASAPNSITRQNDFLNYLLSKLTPEGFLLIVDSSYAQINKRILQIREHLVEQGVPVQAPCVWKGECPALKLDNSPCYAQREFEKPHLIKEIQRASQINLSSLKMSYLIMRNPEAGWPELPDQKLYRVISPPVESFQGKRYYLCGTDGKKNLGSHLKEHPPYSRAFEYLKRGELISIEKALEKGHSLDIAADTIVKVEAACGKPLPQNSVDC